MARTPLFNLRLDEPTRKRWQVAADREHLALSEWIKVVCNLACGGALPHRDDAAARTLHAIPGGKTFKGPDPRPTSSRKKR